TPTPTPTRTTTGTPTRTPATTPTPTAPGPPQDLTAGPANGRGVQLAWSTPASDGGSAVTGYGVYPGGSPSGPRTRGASPGKLTSYKDTGTARGSTYFYYVTAVNAAGEGAASNVVASTAT